MSLNPEQQLVVDEVLNSDERVICILGKAGTGKSYLVSHLAGLLKRKVSITATTNKAKNLLKEATGISNIKTIHSYCGYAMTLNGVDMYLTQTGISESNDYVIVDEVSMLPQKILNTLLDTPTKKIILVGDMTQLPAIGLRADISSYKTLYLTQQMRQEDNPELADWLDKLRECINTKRTFRYEDNPPKGIHIYSNHRDFCKAYMDCKTDKRIISYSNSVVDCYNTNLNQGIRFKVGDSIVLDTPVGYYRNGDIVVITDLKDRYDHYDMVINEEHKIKVYKTKKRIEELKRDSTDYYKMILPMIVNPKLPFASTVHKAQGDSIDEVFIDVSDIYKQLFRKPTKYNGFNKPISVEEYLKLLYVAISRMKSKAHLFIGDKREYTYLRRYANV